MVKVFQSAFKMIYRHTRTRSEMIVVERSFMSNANIYFFLLKRPAFCVCVLKNFTSGKLFKRNMNGWEKCICSEMRWQKNMGVTEIVVSKYKMLFQETFCGRGQIFIFIISDTNIDTGRVNASTAIISYWKIILVIIVNF